MNTVLLAIIAVLMIVLAAFLIPLLIEIRRTAASLRKMTEEELRPALEELTTAMKGIRGVSEKAGEVASDVRRFSKSVSDVGRMIEVATAMVEGVGSFAAIRAMSLKAGLLAGIGYFMKNLIAKGDEE